MNMGTLLRGNGFPMVIPQKCTEHQLGISGVLAASPVLLNPLEYRGQIRNATVLSP